MKLETGWLCCIIGLLILMVMGSFYWGVHYNYFFMDDFHWVARAIITQDSPGEIFTIEGRDFNPVFLLLLSILIKIFGLSPAVLRWVSVLTFSAVIFMFFYLLCRYFKVHPLIAFSAALLAGLNGFVSEVVLNLSAMVYSLSLLLALLAVKFYLDKKKWLFVLFMLLAFFTKESILLVMLPLFLYEKEKQGRLFLLSSFGGMVLLRMLLQLGATTSGYTDFLSTSGSPVKFYFIVLRSLNVSPYSIHPVTGIAVIVVFFLIGGYFIIAKKERGILFFLSFFASYSVFFALLPKLSSRYFLCPAIGFWGVAALLAHYFHGQNEKNKYLKFSLTPLLLISLLFNYPMVQQEVEDYKILGDFSKQFVQKQGDSIKKQLEAASGQETREIVLPKGNNRELALVYQHILERKSLPKLLPFRSHSIGGVIEPRHLVPIIFYPDRITRWNSTGETSDYFKGTIKIR
ncbi:MAG: hypothetical protein GY940_25010 [bacterium]|nr:hypothetical protein [bacterium]